MTRHVLIRLKLQWLACSYQTQTAVTEQLSSDSAVQLTRLILTVSVCLAFCATDALKSEIGESTQTFQDLTTDQEFCVEELLPKNSKFSWWTAVDNQNSNDINKRLNYIVTITVLDEGDF